MSELLTRLDDANTDKDLFDAASAVVSREKAPGVTFNDRSFLLHAPLELCARYFLLSLVDEEHANAARARIRLMAKKYHEYRDADEEQHALQTMPDINVEMWASSTLFASHGPILLALQHLLGETNSDIAHVVHRMNRTIMGDPAAQFVWVNDPPVVAELGPEHIENPTSWMFSNIANIQQTQEVDTISGQISSVQSAGLLDPIVSHLATIATFTDRAIYVEPFKVLLRIAALSMVSEHATHAKFGWSHCATIPHSLFVLLGEAVHPDYLLKSAACYVATFRSTMGKVELHHIDLEEYCEQDEESVFAEHYVRMEEIISHASAHEDAHLLKYTYTCFDMMKRDPHYSKLYIAAAGKLLEIWKSEEN